MRLRVWSTATALALTASLVGLPSLASARSRDVTVPGHLQRGANPHVPWVDRESRMLHVGKRKIHLSMPGHIWNFRRVGARRFVVRVGSSYVWHPGSRLYVVGAGKPKLLTKHFAGGYQLSVKPRGHVVYTTFPADKHKYSEMRVQRVTDGKLIAQHRAPSGVRPLAFRDGKVWRNQNGRLAVWDVHHNTIKHTSHPKSFALDLDHGYGARRAKHHTVVYFPLGKKAHWKPWRHNSVGSAIAGWSPDGRLVAHFAPGYFHEEGNGELDTSRVVLRNARTGKVVRTFRLADGYYGFYLYSARWENSHQLLVPAMTRISDDGDTAHWALLRLGSDGTHRAASRTSKGEAYWDSPPVIPGWTANGTSG